MVNIFGNLLQWLNFRISKKWDKGLKLWWDSAWKKGNIRFNIKSNGWEDVRTVLYTSGEGWMSLSELARELIAEDDEGSLREDATMSNILAYVNKNVSYIEDMAQYGKSEYWQDAYKTALSKKGDCDDHAILIKMLSLCAGIPDYRVKCCVLDVYNRYGSPAGAHMNILYLNRHNNKWSIREGTWRGMPKSTYGRIWFTFNRENTWTQHKLTFDRSQLRKRLAEEVK